MKKTNTLLLIISLLLGISALSMVSKLPKNNSGLGPDSSITSSEEESNSSSNVEITYPYVTYYGFEGIHEDNTVDKLIDKDHNTCAWFASVPTIESYIIIDFGEANYLNGIEFWNGNTSFTDRGDIGCIQVSVDGVDYSESIGDVNIGREINAGRDGNTASVSLEEPMLARYVKLSQIDTGDTWFALREIYVKFLPN